ncbi:hypothetical protein [Shewanella violacea]|uniref:Peptidase M15A C-terminal domain-containing protein n=1 Tax=Shewanella violacea (strain JCM 10179 / CIP 106290 / LMG 19151 / DSS12) TaxID=637905 RepID=D4ZK84_SHEVD|nr:hypothetical protein [Shewanella violacea]BAJ02083.1 hypothetical protein SVI_2112 [Shewanella violacea DSS12]
MKLIKPALNAQASRHFNYQDLIECSDTARLGKVINIPLQDQTFDALQQLAVHLLDPIVDRFGPITLTYGFCSPQLSRAITHNDNPHIAPNIDQHACHELNSKGKLICTRLGAAVDFEVDSMADKMAEVIVWIAEHLEFDRIYYYGKSRPLHISYGPEMNQFVQLMNTDQISGRRTPGNRASGNDAITMLRRLHY